MKQNSYLNLKTIISQLVKINTFKYLGKIIEENGLEKSAIEERIDTIERAYCITYRSLQ